MFVSWIHKYGHKYVFPVPLTTPYVPLFVLQVGREKAAEAGLSSRVLLKIGDAQDLVEIADGSVDKVNSFLCSLRLCGRVCIVVDCLLTGLWSLLCSP